MEIPTLAEKKEVADGGDTLDRFAKFTRVLFRVNKHEVPKHEPKKREVRVRVPPVAAQK